MNDSDQQLDMLQCIYSCAEALRQHADRLPGIEKQSTGALIDRLQQLSERSAVENLSSVHKITDCVCCSLATIEVLPSRLQQIQSRNYSLAAEWLEQLARLYRSGMPEPKKLIYDLLYSFSLLEQAVCAQRSEDCNSFDLFNDDPAATSKAWDNYVQDSDPFAEDPGFGHLFDLLQRTLNHVTDIRTAFPNDPFFQDPQVVVAGTADMPAEDPS